MLALVAVLAVTKGAEQVEPEALGHTKAIGLALRRAAELAVCAVLPAATLTVMFIVGLGDDSLAGDFHHEIYPQATEMLEGLDPYPPPDFDPTAAPNFIWPPVVAFLAAPLTLLPAFAADVVMIVFGLACFAGALWLVGVRDWRVYGVLGLWPQAAGEMRVSHLTPQLCLLLALAWRYRQRLILPGLLVGGAVALKFFVWPLVGWLVVTRRVREAVGAFAIVGASLLLVIPYGLPDYFRTLLRLGAAFDQDSYSLFGLLVQAEVSDTVARAATWLAGAALLAATWRYRSFSLAIATALVLSPIVWLDYFALAAIPLALARPRLSAIWFAPLATWGLQGAGLGIGDASSTIRLLLVFVLVFAVAFHGEPGRDRATPRAAT